MTERANPPFAGDERTMLRAFLDYQRATLRQKCDGLDAEQLARRHPPADLTLGGLMKHLAMVEDWWFGVNLMGREHEPEWRDIDWDADPDWEFHTAADDDPQWLRETFDRTVARSNEILDEVTDLDTVAARSHPRHGDGISLRWILLHMIEEYARHNGHADLIRESVDGSTGV